MCFHSFDYRPCVDLWSTHQQLHAFKEKCVTVIVREIKEFYNFCIYFNISISTHVKYLFKFYELIFIGDFYKPLVYDKSYFQGHLLYCLFRCFVNVWELFLRTCSKTLASYSSRRRNRVYFEVFSELSKRRAKWEAAFFYYTLNSRPFCCFKSYPF